MVATHIAFHVQEILSHNYARQESFNGIVAYLPEPFGYT
jgi:hypothetical protein